MWECESSFRNWLVCTFVHFLMHLLSCANCVFPKLQSRPRKLQSPLWDSTLQFLPQSLQFKTSKFYRRFFPTKFRNTYQNNLDFDGKLLIKQSFVTLVEEETADNAGSFSVPLVNTTESVNQCACSNLQFRLESYANTAYVCYFLHAPNFQLQVFSLARPTLTTHC